MNFARRPVVGSLVLSIAGALSLAACDDLKPDHNEIGYIQVQDVPACDPSIVVKADSPALLITDPEVLQDLSFEQVLQHLNDSWGGYQTPQELAQRLFDGSNNVNAGSFTDSYHCDSAGNPAHVNGPAAQCPRTEGALAASKGFFTPGHKDYFAPVAIVNRFDLASFGGNTCGEARIVYGKQSGLTDPNDRVFVIIEAAVPNPSPGNILGCRKVAQFWKDLESLKTKDELRQTVSTFFYNGMDGLAPPLSPFNLGFGTVNGQSYYGTGGQIRISQHMDDTWELRQLVMRQTSSGHISFDPVTVGNNPLPSLFGPATDTQTSAQQAFADTFVDSVPSLGSNKLHHVRGTFAPETLSGESALGGDALNDYASRAENNTYLKDKINAAIDEYGLNDSCPKDDPLTADSILRRATMDSCAGCHAPAQMLGEERKIGCGMTWPASLGEVHIDEKGQISQALKEVFLPHRADVMTAFLQACDEDAINDAFAPPAPPKSLSIKTSPRDWNKGWTLGGRATH